VLEQVGGTSYAELVRRKVLEPAGMRSTMPHDPRRPPPGRARFYIGGSGGVEEIRPIDPSFKLPGAGYLSTAEDMARFGAALLDTTLLSTRARAEMFRAVPLADGTATIYALGFQSLEEDGRRLLIQPGGGLGIAGWLALYPEQRVAVAILSNLTGSPLGDAPRRAVARSFLSP
jgi:CubicO group peptidase (beta-lactamase class C family)